MNHLRLHAKHRISKWATPATNSASTDAVPRPPHRNDAESNYSASILVLNASTLQGDYTELYGLSLAFILKKISRKQAGPPIQSLNAAIII